MAESGGGEPANLNQGDINPDNHEFVVPTKEVKTPDDIVRWENSEAYKDILGFIIAMNDAVKNTKITDDCHMSQTTQNLIDLLGTLDGWTVDIQPIEQPQRFGNKAFRDWFSRLQENIDQLLKTALDDKFHPAIPEISIYLVESMGNSTRIDYGTGHELAFVAFLCCLFKIGALRQQDAIAVVNKLFNRYLGVVRRVQLQYRMEPAGSQGVWSLDDHQFVPFIWGSSQLLDHKRILPKSFPKSDISAYFATDYLFLGCIKHINQVKTGPFAEHSNQLWNISGVPLWSKVNSGLIKMYKAEILSKYPIIQHFLFGSLLSIKPAA